MKERTVERSAACSTCGKTFARSDTLLRHEKSHLATEDRGPVHRVTNATFRACSSCAQARSRCSGGNPCGRCKVRSLDCTYPNKRRKVATSPDDADAFDEKSTIQFSHSQMKTQQSTAQQRHAPPFEELVFSHTSESSYNSNAQLAPAPSKPVATNTYQVVGTSTQLEPAHSNMEFSSNHHQPVVNMLHQGSPQINANAISAVPEHLATQDPYVDLTQHDYQSTYPPQPTHYGYENGYDDSMNLNWIPLSIYPSPYGDMEQDFSFLLPSLSETASLGTNFDAVPFDAGVSQLQHNHNTETYIPRTSIDHGAQASFLGIGQSPNSSISEGMPAVRSIHGEAPFGETKVKRRKFSHAQDSFTKMRRPRKDYDFPDTSDLTLQINSSAQKFCSEARHATINSTFERLCLGLSLRSPFRSSRFPDQATFNYCVGLYLECFHPTFPLVHAPTVGEDADWLILLAMAAVGSNFAPTPVCVDFREAFQEFLRRAVSDDERDDFHDVSVAQARILNLVCLVQAERPQLKSLAPKIHAELSRWCLESGFLQLTTTDDQYEPGLPLAMKLSAWHKWLRQESQRRVGYFIWLLDCALGYLSNARPLCNMDDARAPLPCPESLWNAATAEVWFEHKLSTPTMPSLCAALEDMYNQKKVIPVMSEVSNILLVHALYSRTWEVGTHIKQPLSEWKATGNARGFLNTPSKDNFWLPLYPLYANWRNSACDCLDVLHWHASGMVAKASGSEHHGVLHLHLARIILLTPFQEIQDLLFFRINHNVGDDSKASFYVHDGSYQRRHPAKLAQIRSITSRWLRADQHKARLAMIHAGSVFWHVRRYSSNSFFEPLAIYLASIVLWTYGSYKSAALEREAADANHGHHHQQQQQQRHDEETHQSQTDAYVQPTRVEIASKSYTTSTRKASSTYSPGNQSNHTTNTANNDNHPLNSPHLPPKDTKTHDPPSPSPSHTSSSDTSPSDSEQPSFIHLDRPCDDEIVQHFVRNGHNMAGYMSNVGDICQTPNKVLVEGAKLLRTKLGCWGVSREFHDVLVKLADGGGRKGERERK